MSPRRGGSYAGFGSSGSSNSGTRCAEVHAFSDTSSKGYLAITAITLLAFFVIAFFWFFVLIAKRKNRGSRKIVGWLYAFALLAMILGLILEIVLLCLDECYIITDIETYYRATLAPLWVEELGDLLYLAVILLPLSINLQKLSGGPAKVVQIVGLVVIGLVGVLMLAYLSVISSIYASNDWLYVVYASDKYDASIKVKAAFLMLTLLAIAGASVLAIVALARSKAPTGSLKVWVPLTLFWALFYALTNVVNWYHYVLDSGPELTVASYLAINALLWFTPAISFACMLGVALHKNWEGTNTIPYDPSNPQAEHLNANQQSGWAEYQHHYPQIYGQPQPQQQPQYASVPQPYQNTSPPPAPAQQYQPPQHYHQ